MFFIRIVILNDFNQAVVSICPMESLATKQLGKNLWISTRWMQF